MRFDSCSMPPSLQAYPTPSTFSPTKHHNLLVSRISPPQKNKNKKTIKNKIDNKVDVNLKHSLICSSEFVSLLYYLKCILLNWWNFEIFSSRKSIKNVFQVFNQFPNIHSLFKYLSISKDYNFKAENQNFLWKSPT